MGKPPAFQFYAADFDMDTGSWTAPQVGVYVRLLMSAWVNGGLPNSMAEIARIARIDNRTLAKMWKATLAKKWTLTPENMYINPRLELERQKQQNYKEKQSLKGKKRAEKMWKDHIAVAKNRLQPEDSSSSSSSSSSLSLKKEKECTIAFETFWKAYPGRSPGSKEVAFKSWKKRIDLPPIDILLEHLDRQKRERSEADEKKLFCPEWPMVTTYLNNGRWNDVYLKPDETAQGWTCKKCLKKVRALQDGLCNACYEG